MPESDNNQNCSICFRERFPSGKWLIVDISSQSCARQHYKTSAWIVLRMPWTVRMPWMKLRKHIPPTSFDLQTSLPVPVLKVLDIPTDSKLNSIIEIIIPQDSHITLIPDRLTGQSRIKTEITLKACKSDSFRMWCYWLVQNVYEWSNLGLCVWNCSKSLDSTPSIC